LLNQREQAVSGEARLPTHIPSSSSVKDHHFEKASCQLRSSLSPHILCWVQKYYLWIAGPDVQLIEDGVKWLLEQRAEERPVYVHCAHGHGRSTVVLCAALVAAGHANSFEEAFQEVQQLRPRVKLNYRQRKALIEWAERRSKLE